MIQGMKNISRPEPQLDRKWAATVVKRDEYVIHLALHQTPDGQH